MSPLMESTVVAFGQSIGIDNLRPDANNLVSLQFEQRGNFCLEGVDDTLLVYLIRPVASYQTDIYREALRLCHYRQGHPLAVQAGLRGEEALVFLVRLSEAQCNLPNLERAMDLLTGLHQQVSRE